MQPLRLEIGSGLTVARPDEVQDFLHDPVGCMTRIQRLHGALAVFTRGQQPFVFAFGPAMNREILTRLADFHIVSRFPGPRRSAQRRFGHGLFSQNGSEHLYFRRLLMPPFRKEALPGHHEGLVPLIDELVRGWHAGQVIDLVREMKELTLRITTRLLFGLDCLEISRAIEGLFDRWLDVNHVVSFSAQLPIDAPTGCYQELLDLAQELEHQLGLLVRRKRQLGIAGDDLLAVMLQAVAAGRMTDLDVIGQTVTLFNAAYHTTTYALTWAVFLLVQHPVVFHQVDREMRELLAGNGPSSGQVDRLGAMDRAIRESLRLLPPVVYMPRITSRAVELGPCRLPPGTMVLASPYVSHHLDEAFPRPDHYEPDRWLAPPRAWSYIPFGGGSRMCLGAPFAVLVVKLALCYILRRFRPQVVPGAHIDRHGTLSLGAQHGVPVLLRPADRTCTSSEVTGNIHEMVRLPDAEPIAARAA